MIIGFVFAGILAGIGSSRLVNTGVFNQWEPLGQPQEGGIELVGTDGYAIYVKTKTDEIFVCSKLSSSTCWKQTTWPPDGPLAASDPLEKDIFWVTNQPNDAIDSIAVSLYLLEHKGEVKYVLLEDGSVWRWYYVVNMMGLQSFYYSFIGGSVGLLTGLLAVFVITKKMGAIN